MEIRSTPLEIADCACVTDSRGKVWKYSEPADVWSLVDGRLGPGSVCHASARSYQKLLAEFGPLRPVLAVTDLVTARLLFANGGSELVELPARQANRDRYLHPTITGVNNEFVRWQAVEFQRREYWVPPGFIGPLPSDDVYVERDPPNRAAMERDLGADVVRREIGQSREGWRSVAVFVEVTA